MKIETLQDILEWTRQLHQQLSTCLQSNAEKSQQVRTKLLLDYLSDHENQLSKLLAEFESSADKKALDSWCYEFFQEKEFVKYQNCDLSFADMSTEQIVEEVISLHNQVIELYRQLNDQFEAPAASTLIQQLLDLEQHEAMRMMQGSNRLEDI